jgi:hypothetical protein
MKLNYILNPSSISFSLRNKLYRVEKTDSRYSSVIKAFNLSEDQMEQALLDILDNTKKLDDAEKKGFVITDKEVTYLGQKLPDVLAQKVRIIYNEGLPLDLFVRFWENLSQNPSQTSVNEIYDFLAYKELPITDDGFFLAYKGLGLDYYSIHGNLETVVTSGTVDNAGRIYNGVGEYIEVLRRNVNDDRTVHCSSGLHCGSLNYSRDFGRRLVIVKVNPKDVVSVPSDYDCQKLRCCAYTVVADYEQEITAPVVDEDNQPIESSAHIERKENTAKRQAFIDRIAKYLDSKSYEEDYVSIRSIQGIFSPQWPSKEQIKDALQELEYNWTVGVGLGGDDVDLVILNDNVYDDYNGYDDGCSAYGYDDED